MRLVTLRTPDGTRAGRVDDDLVYRLPAPDVGALLAGGPDALAQAARAAGPAVALGEVELAPVVPRPGKIVCLGMNYAPHIREMGREAPSHPTLFAKFADALIGPRDDIVLPAVSEQVDWEAELAFVIGRPVRHAQGRQAAEAIAGFTVLNDVSVRDWQRRTLQWLQGKTWEGTTPVGPVLVTPDEVDGARDLAVRCQVDDEVVQEARTSDLIFRPEDVVAYVSTIVTLRPGDLLATGTPGGVGAARDPQVFLRPGNVVRTSIEGIGELVNRCVREEPGRGRAESL